MINSLINAFTDETFQKFINEKRRVIEEILSDFTYYSEEKISKSVNSRIKSVESLREKIKRKNYISKWNIQPAKKDELQNIICANLPDLLGFRINCYFKDDEEKVYKKLKDFLESKENIEVEKTQNLVQKNGHTIYKLACQYREMKNAFSFEVQVKSLIHDTWGEVEHSIVYKSKNFDSRLELKADIIESLYSILGGADKQLQKLYTSSFSKKELERELFYIFTSINEMEKIDSIHYRNFFSLETFLNDFNQNIEKFLGQKLLKNQITKQSIHSMISIDIISEQIKNRIDTYKWEEVCRIASHIYEFSDNDEFLKYVISGVKSINNEGEELEDPFYGDDASEKMEDDENELILLSLSNFLNEEE